MIGHAKGAVYLDAYLFVIGLLPSGLSRLSTKQAYYFDILIITHSGKYCFYIDFENKFYIQIRLWFCFLNEDGLQSFAKEKNEARICVRPSMLIVPQSKISAVPMSPWDLSLGLWF